MGFRCGIVGLPNVGKSTFFNSLLNINLAEVANYPFCTIEPNVGKILLKDDRLNIISNIAGSKKIIYSQLEFVDIAGLIQGASYGEGLGNKFLEHIRSVDIILHVLRCFDNENIAHISGSIDPLKDLLTVETELILSDLERVEKILETFKKKKQITISSKNNINILEKSLEILNRGLPINELSSYFSDNEKKELSIYQLLTLKPTLYICNVSLKNSLSFCDPNNKIFNYMQKIIVYLSKRTDSQVKPIILPVTLDDSNNKSFEENDFTLILQSCRKLLNLITFFTAGKNETKSWIIKSDTKAPQASRIIHSDFERGFIRAEVISFSDYIKYKGESGARSAGKIRLEGKEYTIQDADICHFRFNI